MRLTRFGAAWWYRLGWRSCSSGPTSVCQLNVPGASTSGTSSPRPRRRVRQGTKPYVYMARMAVLQKGTYWSSRKRWNAGVASVPWIRQKMPCDRQVDSMILKHCRIVGSVVTSSSSRLCDSAMSRSRLFWRARCMEEEEAWPIVIIAGCMIAHARWACSQALYRRGLVFQRSCARACITRSSNSPYVINAA